MYCENCGHKLKDKDLYCEECGTKVKRKEIIADKPKKDSSLKIVLIVLGCIFGGLIFLGLIVAFIVLLGYSYVDKLDVDYDWDNAINNYSTYSHLKTDEEFLKEIPNLKDTYLESKDIYSGFYSYYNADFITPSNMNQNILVSIVFNDIEKKEATIIDNTYDIDKNNIDSFKVLDNIEDNYFKLDDLFVFSVREEEIHSRVKNLFNVDIDPSLINYKNDICEGYIRYIDKSKIYRKYYEECDNGKYFTKIANIVNYGDYVKVQEYVGFIKDDKVFDEFDGDYICEVNEVKKFYQDLEKEEKVFRKRNDGTYYLESISDTDIYFD